MNEHLAEAINKLATLVSELRIENQALDLNNKCKEKQNQYLNNEIERLKKKYENDK
jgi:hypothetical protein